MDIRMNRPAPQQIVGNLITWFVAAVALGLIAEGTGADNAWDGIVLGFVASFGFIGTNRITEGLYTEGRNRAAMKVSAPYNFLGFVIMGIILAVWT
jgi:hypothetical protein